MQMTVVLTISL